MCYFLFMLIMCTMVSLHAVLDETVALYDVNRARNLYMFGDYHDQVVDQKEKDQTEHMIALLSKRKEQKPLHLLVEQELTFFENGSGAMLHRLPLLIEQSKMAGITCENIEIRQLALAVCLVLKSQHPEHLCWSVQDSLLSKSYDLSKITFGDVSESFNNSKKQVVQRLNQLGIPSSLYEGHVNQANIFFDCIAKKIDYKDDEQKTIVSVSKGLTDNEKHSDNLTGDLISAFTPLLDLYVVCRVQEISEGASDIALFAGGLHVNNVASILCKLGMNEFHRYPDPNPTEQNYAPLDNQQLNIFELQPPLWIKGYHYAKQLCTGSCLY